MSNLKYTLEEFIKRAIKKHGEVYDYSLVDYKGGSYPVKIICKKHGEFEQNPSRHLGGNGCPTCGKVTLLSLESFIEKANKANGNKYDYSKSNYVNAHTRIKIICKEHGEFEQVPFKHLLGRGCKMCREQSIANKFIKNSKIIHNDRYDYSKVKYEKNHKKVIIICKKHGDFLQEPSNHLKGNGCKECFFETVRNTLNEFVERSTLVHDNKYDYSLVEYNNVNDRVSIICPKHGVFKQTPKSHMVGKGCRFCNKSFMENEVSDKLKELNIPYEEQKRFDFIKNKKPLAFDFYLTKHNILIECQGIQHFKPFEFFGGEENFEYVKMKDEIKYRGATENNIPILYLTRPEIMQFSEKHHIYKQNENIFSDINKLIESINKL